MTDTVYIKVYDNDKVFINGKEVKNIDYIVLEEILSRKTSLAFHTETHTFGTFVVRTFDERLGMDRYSFEKRIYHYRMSIPNDNSIWRKYYFTTD